MAIVLYINNTLYCFSSHKSVNLISFLQLLPWQRLYCDLLRSHQLLPIRSKYVSNIFLQFCSERFIFLEKLISIDYMHNDLFNIFISLTTLYCVTRCEGLNHDVTHSRMIGCNSDFAWRFIERNQRRSQS